MPRLSKIGAACLSAFGFGTGASGVSVDVLVIGGGGAGGAAAGSLVAGGGGAGGVAYQSGRSLSLTNTYTVVIGAGAAGGATGAVQGPNGSNSVFDTITALGGGGGGAGYASSQTIANGLSGGSGGGGGNTPNASTGLGGSSSQTSSGGATGYGNAGGTGFHTPGFATAGGGGGGAGAAGANANTSTGAGGAGGNGLSTWSSWGAATGTGHNVSGTYYYAGGGGGGGNYLQYAAGGYGGGATSGSGGNAAQAAGALANTGGGGGGGPVYTGAGGSGLVIVRYLGAQKFGGGVVSTDGTYTYHTFKTSGQLVPMTPVSADYLIVAGGGGAGTQSAGGGGAGGLLTGSTLSIDTSSTYIVTVGSGGAGAPAAANGACVAGSNGTNSYFSIVSTTAIGGGGSGSYRPTGGLAGATGGSGGGGAIPNGVGGSGTVGQGYAGGQGGTDSNNNLDVGGGGGGAGAAGVSYNDANTAIRGDGGIGVQSSITGTATYYAGGGGGATHNGTRAGTGGLGGGGNGATTNANGANGTANTGGGGGGGSEFTNTGGNGGSGVVIIRYAGTTQLMAGGTVTIVGGYVIHTFTSSGYLTPLTFIGRSLRFRSSASAYLSKTPTVTGNQKTWTFSAWVKRGLLSDLGKVLAGFNNSGNSIFALRFESDNTLNIYSYSTSGNAYIWQVQTTQVFRDPAAWYHITLSIDTTQATASDRVKLYINGTRVTAFSVSSYPSQNTNTEINASGYSMQISTGTANNTSYAQFFDGYMADVRLIDGQALTPNSFGTFNSYGVWQPINYGGSYGTNGFYLPFTNNSASSYAASFNGSSQYLSLPSNSNYALGGVDFTVEGWLYFNSLSGAQIIIENTSNGGSGLSIQTSGSNFVVWSNSQWFSAGTLVTNKWIHFAVVRNGSVSTAYLDGVKIATTTTDAGTSQGGLWIGARATPAYYFNGYMSNIRWVKGTALYTSDFTPTTSPLTAVSGTQLLTLQNSTFVDNSANNATITNNGSSALSTQYPFSVDLVQDKSPQGNHWTPNNISTLLGSNYDSMTDVPTLTSATASNYCVLNPLNSALSAGNASLVNGNLSVTSTGGDNRIGGTLAVTSGKWYFEMKVDSNGSGGGVRYATLAWSKVYTGRTSTYQNYYWNSYEVENDGLAITTVNGSSSTTSTTTFAAGDVVGLALDLDAGTITYYKNGVSQGVVFSGITNDAPWLPSIYTNNFNISVNFGQRPWAYTPPSGFVALNTYNL